MKTLSSTIVIAILFLLWGSADAKRTKNGRRKRQHLRRFGKTKCKRDGDCPEIHCIQAPCPQLVCHKGECLADSVTCGSNTCAVGEVCCNESCGICTEPGGFCTKQMCGPTDKDEEPIDIGCKYDTECPQVRCALGYPCPYYQCQDGQCVDVSDGEPFAPCVSDDQCIEGDICVEDMCAEYKEPDFPPTNPKCKADYECPQPTCLKGAYCPFYVCEDNQCVDKWGGPQCFADDDCPQPDCLPGASSCPGFICTAGRCVQEDDTIFCTDDAKMCPDGSFVSRVAPDCEFAPCPDYIKCKTRADCPHVRCMFGAPGCPDYACDEEKGICIDMNEVEGEVCGSAICGEGQYCCNRSCSMCAPFPDGMCTQQVCDFVPAVLDEEPGPEPLCCKDPKPSDVECGRSGCHCCGDGEWLLGNSGPTLPSSEACGKLGPSKPCETEVKCCKDPKPSDVECGRSGCHCCGDGEWLLGNSGPTLPSSEACGDLGPSEPCEIEGEGEIECRTDADCPVINCIRAPCPTSACNKEGMCIIIEPH